MRISSLSLFGASLTLMSGCVNANRGVSSEVIRSSAKTIFSYADKNRDGYLDRAEWSEYLTEIRSRISVDEASSLEYQREMFDKADLNDKGKINLNDLTRAMLTDGLCLDVNRNGLIEASELTAMASRCAR